MMSMNRKRDCKRAWKGRYLWCCALFLGFSGRGAGFQTSSSFPSLTKRESGLAYCQREAQRARRTLKVHYIQQYVPTYCPYVLSSKGWTSPKLVFLVAFTAEFSWFSRAHIIASETW